ncbi:hypothetical protein, partial [Escherichia coli]|uniref:hypothetical protein n=1 Tax=Escherichia coli TaxID=562 RepID=UPI001BFCEB29
FNGTRRSDHQDAYRALTAGLLEKAGSAQILKPVFNVSFWFSYAHNGSNSLLFSTDAAAATL